MMPPKLNLDKWRLMALTIGLSVSQYFSGHWSLDLWAQVQVYPLEKWSIDWLTMLMLSTMKGGILYVFSEGQLLLPSCCAIVMLAMARLPCFLPSCLQLFKSQCGHTYHMCSVHSNMNSHPVNIDLHSSQSSNGSRVTPTANCQGTSSERITYLHLTGMSYYIAWCVDKLFTSKNKQALPCSQCSDFLTLGMLPPPRKTPLQGDWMPFSSEAQFKVANLLYHCTELSASNIDALLEIWAQLVEELDADQCAPFENCQDMYATINASTLGDTPWQCLVTGISDDIDKQSLNWMQTQYKVWYCDPGAVVSVMLSNPDFDGQFDLCPYIDLDACGKRQWNNIMLGNITWQHSVSISASLLSRNMSYSSAHRMISPQLTQWPKVQCTALSFLAVIRQQSP